MPFSPEYFGAVAALFAGAAVGTFMAARRNAATTPAETNTSARAIEETDDVADENLYASEVLPEAERNHPELVKRIRATARALADGGRKITTDDIHKAMPLPAGIDGRVLGAAFFPRREWHKCGYTPSTRRENHSRPIAQWMLRQYLPEAAE